MQIEPDEGSESFFTAMDLLSYLEDVVISINPNIPEKEHCEQVRIFEISSENYQNLQNCCLFESIRFVSENFLFRLHMMGVGLSIEEDG